MCKCVLHASMTSETENAIYLFHSNHFASYVDWMCNHSQVEMMIVEICFYRLLTRQKKWFLGMTLLEPKVAERCEQWGTIYVDFYYEKSLCPVTSMSFVNEMKKKNGNGVSQMSRRLFPRLSYFFLWKHKFSNYWPHSVYRTLLTKSRRMSLCVEKIYSRISVRHGDLC